MTRMRLSPTAILPLILSSLLVACTLASDGVIEPIEGAGPLAGEVDSPAEMGGASATGTAFLRTEASVEVEVERASVPAAGSEPMADEAGPAGASPLEPAYGVPMATAPAESMAMPLAEGERTMTEPASVSDPNSRLTAGEVDDNAGWDDYLLYLRNYSGAAVIRMDVSERHQIWVKDAQDRPVLDARIGIEVDGQEITSLRTHSDGRAYFFPRTLETTADSYTVKVQVNDVVERFDIPGGGSQREWTVTLPGAASQELSQARLDVLFLIDATGSMADEINQLKENIHAISGQIDALPSQPDVRFGMVAYRDRGDEYITRVSDFTPDVEEFATELDGVYADGGGDYPEDLNEALSKAIHEPEWRIEDTVSLIFLVADAPPHLDYGQQNHYALEVLEAAERGIKVFPIASSGLDSQGEYIFRQLAQVSGGRFIFLTYGVSGPGSTGTETDFQVSDYTVSALDALVVKIVEEELSYLR